MRGEFGRSPEMRERPPETLRRSFEYRDVEGRLIGRAEVELDAEEVELEAEKDAEDPPVRARKLRSFVLRGERGGLPTEVDMLRLDPAHAGAVGVYVTSERVRNYEYDDVRKRATVPPLETPTDVGVFLHELGHASQHHEGRFAGVADLYGDEKDVFKDGKTDLTALRSLVMNVREAVPEAAHLLTDEHLDELTEIEADVVQRERDFVFALGANVREMSRKQPDAARVAETQKRADEVKAELDDLKAEFAETMADLRVRDFVELPTRMLERDATRRALEWARRVRKEAGIDLFARHAAPAEATMSSRRAADCVGSTAEGLRQGDPESATEETDLIEDLRRALDSYGADRLRMRDPERPDDIGITPVAGGRRRKP